jgi:phosphoglycerol transferase MdoB-like AlkP superfamily enzyme
VNVFLPPPINYMFIVLQAVLLALSGLFIKNVGGTYAGAVGGLLTALGSPGLGLFTFIASVLFGVLVDVALYVFKINGTYQGVNRNRLIAAMAVSTMLIGVITYSASVILPEYIYVQAGIQNMTLIIQRSLMLDVMVMFMGPATGATAGYAAAYLWNRYLKTIALTL